MKEIKNLPKHIAIIPDGNRRWAKKNKLKAWFGHKQGTKGLESIVSVIIDLKISHLSFWGSSKDNLKKRPKQEVKFLLKLFKERFLELSESEIVHQNQIKINILGDWREQFPKDVKSSLNQAMLNTKNYNKFFVNFFIAYSGTGEVLDAIKCIAKKARKNLSLKIDQDLLKDCLLTRNLPAVDLMIRTGGEPHNSDGFMMWDTANAQLYFSEKMWPDFNKQDFRSAIENYGNRPRKFGS